MEHSQHILHLHESGSTAGNDHQNDLVQQFDPRHELKLSEQQFKGGILRIGHSTASMVAASLSDLQQQSNNGSFNSVVFNGGNILSGIWRYGTSANNNTTANNAIQHLVNSAANCGEGIYENPRNGSNAADWATVAGGDGAGTELLLLPGILRSPCSDKPNNVSETLIKQPLNHGAAGDRPYINSAQTHNSAAQSNSGGFLGFQSGTNSRDLSLSLSAKAQTAQQFLQQQYTIQQNSVVAAAASQELGFRHIPTSVYLKVAQQILKEIAYSCINSASEYSNQNTHVVEEADHKDLQTTQDAPVSLISASNCSSSGAIRTSRSIISSENQWIDNMNSSAGAGLSDGINSVLIRAHRTDKGLSVLDLQELKRRKLAIMLEELEKKFIKYEEQMREKATRLYNNNSMQVVSEEVVMMLQGAAPFKEEASKAIERRFKQLKDAITNQVQSCYTTTNNLSNMNNNNNNTLGNNPSGWPIISSTPIKAGQLSMNMGQYNNHNNPSTYVGPSFYQYNYNNNSNANTNNINISNINNNNSNNTSICQASLPSSGGVWAFNQDPAEYGGLGMTSGSRVPASSSRLRLLDQQFRHQRALQQVGLLHAQPWRPQRGLPERSVSVLRAWLFDHFLHPYPKDTEKVLLARQTGLTRNQVSNWFINARVRLWKPLVEEMYQEELKAKERRHPSATNQSSNNKSKEVTSNTNLPHSMVPHINAFNYNENNTGKHVEFNVANQALVMQDMSSMNEDMVMEVSKFQIKHVIPTTLDNQVSIYETNVSGNTPQSQAQTHAHDEQHRHGQRIGSFVENPLTTGITSVLAHDEEQCGAHTWSFIHQGIPLEAQHQEQSYENASNGQTLINFNGANVGNVTLTLGLQQHSTGATPIRCANPPHDGVEAIPISFHM